MNDKVSQSLCWAIIVALSLIVGIASALFFGPDNKIEEIAESVIKQVTGIDADISEGEE